MKNKIDNKIRTAMKKKNNFTTSGNVAAGFSTAGGAAVGVAAGSMVAHEAYAETPEGKVEVENVEPATAKPQTQPKPDKEVQPEPTPMPTPEPDKPAPTPEPIKPESDPEPEARVVDYQTVTNEDGSQMDVAVIAVNDQAFVVADVDMDGTADVLVADLNGNNQVDEDEIADISDQGVDMSLIKDEFESNAMGEIVQNDGPDYINDADVNDYMA